MTLHIIHGRVIICLLFLLSVSPFANSPEATAQSGTTVPVLTSAVASSLPIGSVTVSGNGFTSGGLVYVVLYDQWGSSLQETRWTSASTAVYGVNGSIDPALGYVAGGRIQEVFEQFRATIYGPNGSMDPALGYRPGTDLANPSEAIYGPNGSMDPAQGYIPGNGADQILCDQPLMVRAFDNQTAAWSNLVDVDSGC